MLMGIVKFDGEVADLDKDMNDVLRASSRRCFEAGFLYGVNENGGMIRFDPQIKAEIFVQQMPQPGASALDDAPDARPKQPAEPGPAAKPAAESAGDSEPEKPATKPENPDRTGAK